MPNGSGCVAQGLTPRQRDMNMVKPCVRETKQINSDGCGSIPSSRQSSRQSWTPL
jgi:hypothetical protein